MKATVEKIAHELEQFNDRASDEERRTLAMLLIFNIAKDLSENSFEAIGMIECVKKELIAEFEEEKPLFSKN